MGARVSDPGIFWPAPRQAPALGADSVHVWCAELDVDSERLDACRAVLSEDERARAARFRFDRDRVRFTAARGTLRFLLGRYLSRPAKDLAFVYGEQGKPGLADRTDLGFNVSHTQGLGVWAFRYDRPLGVDVEWVHRGVDHGRIARRFFSEREWRALFDLPADDLAPGFFRCWTQKEAFVKALGDGLTFSLKAFDVAVAGPARLLRLDGADASAWAFYSLAPADGFVGALATQGEAHLACYRAAGIYADCET